MRGRVFYGVQIVVKGGRGATPMWSDWIGPWPGIASRMSSADSQTHGNQKMQRGQTSETHIMRQSKKKKKKKVFFALRSVLAPRKTDGKK